ncbi:hypothetical protein ABFT51_07620 [Paenibacillus peoriae]|uniref:hypothetical protein n=1 Tax=Paenibacillus TaxID=44249 RepID=UPI0023797F1A|nr:hypothetical protein [Paenibacillus polymyxa]WDM22646.1 hypothetical protein J4I02_03225 [Paenibacillus polymyxa]
MRKDVEWTVSGGGKGTTPKHKYVPRLKVSDDFNDSQKQMVETYNSMRDWIDKNGGMETKKGS